MSVILAFLFGCVAGSLVTQYWPWVRGALGAARDRVFGARPARAATITEVRMEAPAPSASSDGAKTAKPVQWTRALTNILAFFAGLFGWIARNPILAAGIAVLLLFVFVGGSCVRLPQLGDLFKSRDTVIAERDNANVNTAVEAHGRTVDRVGAEAGERTLRDARRRVHVIAQAEQELEDAVSQADFDGLHAAYARAHSELWSGYRATGEPDQPESRSGPVHSAPANPV